MRSKPDVDLRISRTVHPGDAVLVELTLQSRSETPVDFVELTLDGNEIQRLGEHAPRQLLSLRARVAREETLGALLGAPLRCALLAFDEVRLDDTRATVWSRTPGPDQPWLGVFLGHLAALASEITDATARVPPPASMAAARPAWEASARDLRGRLEVGRMSIRDARLDGALFQVETCFEVSPRPDRTEITLVLVPPLETPPDLDDPAARAACSPAVQSLLRAIQAEARALRVSATALVATLAAPLEDPGAARDLMGSMLQLAQRLRGQRGAGPYR